MAVEATHGAPPEAQASQLIMQIGSGYILSAALHAAAKLDIADKLSAGPRSAASLADEAGVIEDRLYRVLRALASVGIFHEHDHRRFSNTPASELLRTNAPNSLRKMTEFICEPFHFRTYAELDYTLHTGKPGAEKVAGEPVFQYFPKHPELSELFNDAMTSFSSSMIPAVLDAYDFSGISTLVDVAGGHGAVLTAILQRYPSLRGILLDLDHVVAGAKPKIAAAGLAGRCETVAGDFFKGVPPGGDAYIMKHIIHDWEDDRATAILRHIRTALNGVPNGRVLLLEGVVQPGNGPGFSKVLDLEMMMFPGGRERTADQFAELFAGAGFKLTRIVPTASSLSVIEAHPA